jgi:hypothetical protein
VSPAPILAVSSLWFNMEALLATALSNRWARILLGVCGGAANYCAPDLTEFELPATLAGRLERRASVRLEARTDRPGQPALRAWLASEGAAIVAVDSFHLRYRPAFGRVHSGRTIIVRRGSVAGSVGIEDRWPPAWRGEIPLRELEAARSSQVPLDPCREPVFAGVPLGMRWWSFSGPEAPPADITAWLRGRLADLALDEGEGGPEGATALILRAAAAAVTDTPAGSRRLSLLLRAELSSRAYVAALLEAASSMLGDGLLAGSLDRLFRGLDRAGEARDLLIKHCVRPDPLYRRTIIEDLEAAATDLAALAPLLVAYAPAPARELIHA